MQPVTTRAQWKKLFKTGFFHIFGGNVINKIIGFLTSIIIVRILTKTEYGFFTYAWNIYSIIFLFSALGVDFGMLQLSSERSGDLEYAKGICNYSTRFGLKFNIILLALMMGIGLFAPLSISGGGPLICSLSLMPMTQFLLNIVLYYLRSQKLNKEYAFLVVLNNALTLVISIVAVFFVREMGLVIGHYFSNIVVCVVGIVAFKIPVINNTEFDSKDDQRDLLKISVISMADNGLSQLLYLLDVFILGILDPQEVVLASYKVATMIPTALIFIPHSVIIYLYPYFSEHKDDGKWCITQYKRVLKVLGGFNLLITLFLIIAAPDIISIMFGAQYLDAVPVFRILSINYFISGTFRAISGNLLVTQRKLKYNLMVSVITSFINILADFLFVQWWGAKGAAYATLLVVVISSVMSTTYLISTFKKKAA